MTTTFEKEVKPGTTQTGITWDQLDVAWDQYPGTLDEPGEVDATPFTKEVKP